MTWTDKCSVDKRRVSDMGTAKRRGVEWRGGGQSVCVGGVFVEIFGRRSESGVSVIGKREIVRPHCFLGSPSS